MNNPAPMDRRKIQYIVRQVESDLHNTADGLYDLVMCMERYHALLYPETALVFMAFCDGVKVLDQPPIRVDGVEMDKYVFMGSDDKSHIVSPETPVYICLSDYTNLIRRYTSYQVAVQALLLRGDNLDRLQPDER